jgi:hypothetical protein
MRQSMRIGVCGIACEACPRRTRGKCPNGDQGCLSRKNKLYKICNCAFQKCVKLCFQCPSFPCETIKEGPIPYEYCLYILEKR